MRKYWFSWLVLIAVMVSACSQPTAVPTPVPPTAAPTTAPTSSASSPTIVASGPATCRPYSLLDQVLPPPDPKYPGVQPTDWTQGPADAKLTLIVYSDFQ
jgi:hypothetical protein